MSAPDSIKRLVDNFDQNKSAFLSPHYKEAQLRLDFLNPFFVALGWQLTSDGSTAEANRDVIIESSVRVEGSFKAPDYAFRIGPTPKFFVEAKKPSVNLEKDTSSAFQVRSYAWSAKLPVSILSDFEEFAVYDCRNRPDRSDSAATDRIKLLNYKEYLTRWDEIEDVFSKKAVWAGKLDEWISNSKGKKGTLEVDDAFLQEIEKWRDLLAHNLALRNPGLSTRELNYAVQMTIDRIIFLRICEDRQIENEDCLKDVCAGEDIYPELVNLFRKADTRYNSGLFHFNAEKGQSSTPDDLTPALSIDDKVLKEIVSGLYYPSPYVFRVLPADILGQVYERFLGKVIRLTAGHQAKVEEKPEVRKAGGVYYTPTYIVDYIVKNTVGKLLENKTPVQAASLKIVDPACGSGSFLLGAYQYLLDWHIKWYSDNQPEKWAKGKSPAIYQAQGGWRLTTAEKKKILINNIHGVDIDPQAVEVTKLSLSLKVLEGESQETINSQLSLFKERALPDLGKNIQCGNSLIGSDYNKDKLFTDEDERLRVNPFDWKVAFPQVFAQGGFDAVIGNPPYLFITELCSSDKKYYFSTFKTAEYRFDVYGLFIENTVRRLLNQNGFLSFITPHTLLNNDSFAKLRELLITTTYIEKLIDIGPGVFEGAKNETMVFVIQKSKVRVNQLTSIILTNCKIFPKPVKETKLKQSIWSENKNSSWLIKIASDNFQLINKIQQLPIRLGTLCTINQGLRTGNNNRFLSENKLDNNWKPAAGGKNVGRYAPLKKNKYVLYDPKLLDAPRKAEIFNSPEKIVVQEIRNITLSRRIIATYDDRQFYCLQSTNVINLKQNFQSKFNLKYLLGILNSSTINYFFRETFSGNNHIASNQLAQIPIPDTDNIKQSKIAGLVEKILSLIIENPHTPQEKEALQREIAATDKQIDNLVYQLYGLTAEEIKIVEGNQ